MNIQNNYENFLYKFIPASDRLFDIMIPDAACNMKCKYCFGEHCVNIRNSCSTELNINAINESLKTVDRNKEGWVSIWGGEPLYNGKQLKETVAYIKNNFPKAHIDMMTNGSLLTDEWTKFIIDNKINIGISHDGPAQKYRGYDFLENKEICKNIIDLRHEKLFFTFNVIYHRLNSSTQKILEYYMRKEDELGVELGVSPRLIRNINKPSEPYIFKPKDYPIMDQDIEWVVALYMRKLLDGDSKFIRKYFGELHKLITNLIDELHPDGSPAKFIKDVPNCGCLSYPHVAITGDLVFCNSVLESRGLEEAKALRTSFKTYPKCDTCKVNNLCLGLCSALTYDQLESNCDMFQHYYTKYRETIRKYYGETSNKN